MFVKLKLRYLFNCSTLQERITTAIQITAWTETGEASYCPLHWLTAWARLPALYWCFLTGRLDEVISWAGHSAKAMYWSPVFSCTVCVCVCGISVWAFVFLWKTEAVEILMTGRWDKWDPSRFLHKYIVCVCDCEIITILRLNMKNLTVFLLSEESTTANRELTQV